MNSTTTLDRPLSAEPAFAGLRGQSFMELTTYRKTSQPATRVWFAEDGGRLYKGMASLGLVGARTERLAGIVAPAVALVVTVGMSAVPVAVLFGLLA